MKNADKQMIFCATNLFADYITPFWGYLYNL
jgi:hypothetical protein